MKTYYVDTNVFLRYLLKDNPDLYKQAEVLFNKAKKAQIKLLAHSIVIFEIDFVLRNVYKFPKEVITQKIEVLLASKYLLVDESIVFHQAIIIYQQSSNSLVDCFLLAKSKIEDCELFTFDKKLANQK